MAALDVKTLLSNPQKYENLDIAITGLVRRINQQWYIVDEILEKFDIQNAIEVKEYFEPKPVKWDFSDRFEEFLKYVESKGIDGRDTINQKYEQLKENGLSHHLDYFIEKNLIEPYDDIVHCDKRFQSKHFSFVDFKTSYTHWLKSGTKFWFFNTHIRGKFKVDKSGQQMIGSITPSLLIIRHKNTHRFIPPILINTSLLKHREFPQTPLIEILRKPERYIDKQVRIRGVWKKSVSKHLYYIIPGYMFDLLKPTSDEPSSTPTALDDDVIMFVPNYIKPHKQFSLQIIDNVVQNYLDNGFLEGVGGDITRSEHIVISGTIKKSPHTDFTIAIDDVAEFAYKCGLGTYYIDLKSQ